MKKIISSLLALAMFVAVGVTMVGCDKVSGKEYEYTGATRTVITKITEDGKIEETKTLTIQDYAKVMVVWMTDPTKSLDDALEAELDEDQTEAYEEMVEEMFGDMKVTMTFKNGKVASTESYSVDGSMWEEVQEGTYEVVDGVIYLTRLEGAASYYGFEDYKIYETETTTMKITEDGNLVVREVDNDDYNDADYVYTDADVFSATNMGAILYMEMTFSPVK